jgi:hypothetical protein
MKKSFIILFVISIISVQVTGKPILDRAWDFKSSADVTFVINDTLSVNIHFPGAVPDDRLIGYCHLSISINDSNPGANIKGKSFAYLIKFDSGFNAFDHVLTLNINYASGLLAKKVVSPYNYKMYMDPYPVSKLHQWFPASDSNVTVNTTSHTISVVYRHKKLLNAPNGELQKTLIASNGYPFDYGLFFTDSSASIHIPKHNNKTNNIDISQKYRIYTLDGRCADFVPSAKEKVLSGRDGCFIIQMNQREFRRMQNVRF